MTSARHVHFVGIGGIHMSGLASILLDDGIEVSGSDMTQSALTDALAAKGARIFIGHAAPQVVGAELVVWSAAIPDDNPELVAAREGPIELVSRAQMVARVAVGRRTLTVAGSHGKTTTSTMLTLILRQAGLDPSYILGGESTALPSHAARGAGAQIVLEADEYARAFHEYQPSVAAIINLERDHLDYYGSDDNLRDAFVEHALTIEPDGRLIVGAESPCAMRVAETLAVRRADVQTETFGLAETGGWDWSAAEIASSATGVDFELRARNESLGTVALATVGTYNVRNALAASAIALREGASITDVQAALSTFAGVHRRFETVGEASGVTVVDDYAHHPTEITAVIAAARMRFPERRLVVLFQPHTYSRSQYLLEGFRGCFADADVLYLSETYPARETPDQGMPAVDLADRIDSPRAIYLGPLSEAVVAVAQAAVSGDVILTLGAGDIEAAGAQIVERLPA